MTAASKGDDLESQGAGKSIDRILLADQDQLTWSAGLGPKAIANFEPSSSEGVLRDRHLVLALTLDLVDVSRLRRSPNGSMRAASTILSQIGEYSPRSPGHDVAHNLWRPT